MQETETGLVRADKVPRSVLGGALGRCRAAFVGVGLMTAMMNVLYLTGSFFMLEVYDRVVPGRSVPTLIGLATITLVLYAFTGLLEMLRGRILVRIGGALDEATSSSVYELLVTLPLRGTTSGLQPLRDLDQVKGFLSTPGPAALFDLPWMPFYLAICFIFHPLIGLTATIGATILLVLTALTELLTRVPINEAAIHGSQRHSLAEASRRNAEVLRAMGMAGSVASVWLDANAKHIASNRRAADVAGGFGAASKTLRMVLQSAVLGVGAYLVIHQQATAGIMIAGSILAARALAPVELAIAHWRGFVGARQSWHRLNGLLARLPAGKEPMTLPTPSVSLVVEGLSVSPPGNPRLVVQEGVRLVAGDGLGIIGPSASGKSSLARTLVGAWQPARGKVRFDGAAIEQWPASLLGRSIGYLPQDVELFAGTVAQNIGRFAADADAEGIIAAANAAGLHDMILQLPEGYETQIGEAGAALSAGQRQRLGLARALYGGPFLLVLDEPNSNLDADGEEALTAAILGHRRRGGIAVVIAHRPSALNALDLVLAMTNGRIQAFGPKDEVLGKVVRRGNGPIPGNASPSASALRIVDAQPGMS